MKLALLSVLNLLALASLTRTANGQDKSLAFNDKTALAGWTVSGDVAIDNSKDRSGQHGGSLRIGPGGKAVWQLRDTDGAGKVELWVYDDLKSPDDPKERRPGPRWGLIQMNGHVIVMGVIYAPYLGGETTYAITDSDQKIWFANIQHTRFKRTEGWVKWTFDFDPENGLSVYCGDSSDTGKERKNKKKAGGAEKSSKKGVLTWDKTSLPGFCGVAIFGDSVEGKPQTIWVDDLSVQLGGAVKPKPVVVPPPTVPDKDPAVEKPVSLLPAVKDKHPRLLFTAEDVPAMKRRALGPSKTFFDGLMSYLPSCKPPENSSFQKNATEGQRVGVWQMPTVALHYVLTGDRESFNRAVGYMKKLLELENWETGKEKDSGMSAGNIMAGAALTFDWLYNDLEPQFREAFRKKLLLHARRMYYGGHLARNPGTHYWQADPRNNHRYHRDAGLALCALAAASGAPEENWILAETFKELKFIHDWLPEDGTSHESPSYMIFGNVYLVLALDASDRCFGTKYLAHPFFKNNPQFRMATLTPGQKDVFRYGDAAGFGFINDYLFKCTSRFQLKDAQAGLLAFREATPKAFAYGWFSLIWFDPSLGGGAIDNLPKNSLFPDLGAAFMRDGWGEKNVGVMFKCGPYGGHSLNRFRNEHEFCYINVAHDDPDANMFAIFANGNMVAQDDGYSRHKVTSSHNTILVNGAGQKGEGRGWMQPLKNVDMNALAKMVAWKDAGATGASAGATGASTGATGASAGDVAVAEGEAAGMYEGLERYRRTFVWVESGYVLILDDIRATAEADLTWLVQAAGAQIVDQAKRHYRLTNGAAQCDFHAASNCEIKSTVADSTADSHGESMGLKQIRIAARTKQWRLATVFDPWNRGNVEVAMKSAGPGAAEVAVTGPGFADVWQWPSALNNDTPTALKAQRKEGFVFELTDRDKVPGWGR